MKPRTLLTDANLPDFLRKAGVFPPGETIGVEPAGDGNINWVRRARGASGSRVVKQARPALERFPEYRVSTERIVFEARFYECAAPLDAERVCPRVLHFDPDERVLVLEDLGDAPRLDAALARGDDVADRAAALARFLARLHGGTRDPGLAARFANDDMRRLHGDHVFHLPYRANDFPLSPAVSERAEALRADRELVARIDAAYERYLGPGEALVHGDVQSSNVLLPAGRTVLLDAEIAHFGDPAFDLGQLLAHLVLPAAARGEARSAAPALGAAGRAYAERAGADAGRLARAVEYAGIELLRRTVGAARVPAVASDAASRAVIDLGLEWIRSGPPAWVDLPG